jgi:hypothetical protein
VPNPRLPFAERLARVSGKVWIGVWAALALVGISSLSVSHMAAMPPPDKATRMAMEAATLRQGSSGLFLVHVIYRECSCTERLLAHLLARGRLPGVEEAIVYVARDSAAELAGSAARAGFALTRVTAEELDRRFGLQAAPVLLAFDSAQTLLYAGGYFDHPSAVSALDRRIHADIAAGRPVRPLPLFGCAVSPALQDAVDPLRIVYPRD